MCLFLLLSLRHVLQTTLGVPPPIIIIIDTKDLFAELMSLPEGKEKNNKLYSPSRNNRK
jgi:hypothetical protein